MTKVKSVANFDCKYVTIDDGSVYAKFDFGGFYEWYKVKDKTFSLLDIISSKELEESLEDYESSREPNVIHLGEIGRRSGRSI
jgi:hypothetical protein